MGTNYYFQPKGLEKIDEISNNYLDCLKVMRKEYIDQIKLVLRREYNNYKNYEDILNLPNLDTEDYLVSVIESPNIHICKLSAGWIPLFEKTKFYSNFKELEDFYINNAEFLNFVNEYGEEINFYKFKDDVLSKCNKNNISHLQYNSSYDISYYKDELRS